MTPFGLRDACWSSSKKKKINMPTRVWFYTRSANKLQIETANKCLQVQMRMETAWTSWECGNMAELSLSSAAPPLVLGLSRIRMCWPSTSLLQRDFTTPEAFCCSIKVKKKREQKNLELGNMREKCHKHARCYETVRLLLWNALLTHE